MLLENKVAVIYGAGSIGGAITRAFVREGAKVFLANRTQGSLDKAASQIKADGGTIQTTVVDALDEQAVNRFVDSVIQQAGSIDISVNVIGVGDIQKPMMEISLSEFLQPIHNTMQTQFITTRAAAPHMIARKSGVILTFGGGGPQTLSGLGGFKISLDALEGLRRQWAMELGEYGIRVITLKTGGIGESIDPGFGPRDEIIETLTKDTLLKRLATLADVGNVAAFAASDHARSITSTEINISAGAIVD